MENLSKMNKLNSPTWLVSLEIAKEFKGIGFDEPTLFHYYENDFDVTVETNSYYDEGEAQGYLHLKKKTLIEIRNAFLSPFGNKPSLGSEHVATR